MASGNPSAIARHRVRLAHGLGITAALLTAACSTPGDTADAVAGDARATGVVASIDTGPWTYDGNAVVQVETAGDRRLQVQLPARWNLCQAAPVDIEALAVGMRVDVVGAVAGEEDVVVVCADASHRLAPVDAR